MTLDTDRIILTPIKQSRGMTRAGMRFHNDNENFEDFRSRQGGGEDEMRSQYMPTGDNEEFKDDPHQQHQLNKFEQMTDNRSFKENQITDRSLIPRQQRNNEDLIVPAHNLKKPIDFNTVNDKDFGSSAINDDQQEDELSLQSIAPSQRPIADAILPYLGEPTTVLLFAKSWQNREKGITQLIAKVNEIFNNSKDSVDIANTAVV